MRVFHQRRSCSDARPASSMRFFRIYDARRSRPPGAGAVARPGGFGAVRSRFGAGRCPQDRAAGPRGRGFSQFYFCADESGVARDVSGRAMAGAIGVDARTATADYPAAGEGGASASFMPPSVPTASVGDASFGGVRCDWRNGGRCRRRSAAFRAASAAASPVTAAPVRAGGHVPAIAVPMAAMPIFDPGKPPISPPPTTPAPAALHVLICASSASRSLWLLPGVHRTRRRLRRQPRGRA